MSVKTKLKRKVKRNKKLYIFVITILVLLLGGLFIYDSILLPQIKLKSGNKIFVSYKSEYKEKGYSAKHFGKDITSKVKVSGKVNTNKIGEYKVTYKVKDGMFNRTITRVVSVVDDTKPKLSVDNSDLYVCPGDEVVPEKVEAKDDFDGDISKKVKHKVEDNYLVYTVTDSNGNTEEVKKKIIYKDKEKPKITLNGNTEMYVNVGNGFEDPGVKAEDNCDGDITSNVKVEGSVDTSKVGEYQITYTIEDKAGNKETANRKVIVSNGIIYLTFDDGPNSGTTNVILDILKSEGVKATFFVTNNGPDELIKREFDEGHTVALHTASHDYSIVYASVDSYFKDLYSVQDRVKRITGVESKIIRFPGGASNTVSRKYSQGIMTTLTQEVVNRGFKYYDWNLSSGDAAGGSPTADTIYNNVVSNLRHDRVNMVLMHDIKTYTRDALKNIIKYGKNNGYRFEKITMDTEMITQRVNN